MKDGDLQRYAAEFLGTYLLVFFAAGAVMTSAMTGAASGQIIGGVSSGLVLMIVIWAFGGVSGGHVNPALTIALVVLRIFPARLLVGYVVSQLAGSAAAGLSLLALLGDVGQMGANLPNVDAGITPGQAFGIELILSAVMMLVIIGAIKASDALGTLAPVPIGAIVGIEVMLFGSIAGAAMNPARAFGPTLALGDWTHFWIYLLGPLLGLLAAGWISVWIIEGPDGRKA